MNRTITSAAIGAGVLGGALVGASFVGTAGAYGDAENTTPDDVETTNVLGDEQQGNDVQIQDAEMACYNVRRVLVAIRTHAISAMRTAIARISLRRDWYAAVASAISCSGVARTPKFFRLSA